MIDHGFIHSIYAFDPNGIPIEFSHNVQGIDVRKNPQMADSTPTPVAQEGPEPNFDKWPRVERPTPQKERMVSLMGALEEKDIFLRILGSKTGEEGLTITIGEENQEGEIQFCSIVASPYLAGEGCGSIGVLGPTRMEYSKLVTIVDYTARVMSEVLEHVFHKPEQGHDSADPRKVRSK